MGLYICPPVLAPVLCAMRRAKRRRLLTSVAKLVTAIDLYIAHHNSNSQPFIWTKSARDIVQKVICANSHPNTT